MRIPASFRAGQPAAVAALLAMLCAAPAILAQELKPIQLPKPQITAGMPLMQALARRQTPRAFLDKPLPLQTLSNLLWAAFGVNRPREMKAGMGRTAPSAMNKQEIQLEVVLAEGVYVYEAEANVLRPLFAGDIRGKISPSAAAHAAVTLVYVAGAKDDFAQVDTGFIGQNVYLFCASEGLGTVFRGAVDYAKLAKTLNLPDHQFVTFAQTVGYAAS